MHTQNPSKLLLFQTTHSKNGLWPVTGKTGSLCSLGLQISRKISPYQAHCTLQLWMNSQRFNHRQCHPHPIHLQSGPQLFPVPAAECLCLNGFPAAPGMPVRGTPQTQSGPETDQPPISVYTFVGRFCRHSTPQTETSHPYQSTCLLEWFC